MEIEKLEHCPLKNPAVPVKVTEMGNVIEEQYMSNRNRKQTVQMLEGGEQYVILSTGEIKDVEHHETRADNRKSLYKTFRTARALINTNVTDVEHCRWITLTYAENMTDTKQLYKDFEKFNKRFQYYCKKQEYGKPEYIVMMEPQGRGAWHAHLLYIWDCKAPFIENSVLADLWGHGFVKIKKLDNVDNVGAYLTAYLGDMELQDAIDKRVEINGTVKTVETLDDDGKKVTKSVLKGARLYLYPANFNMIRYSRGIKKPTVEMLPQKKAEKKVSGATKTFEKTVKITDGDNDFETIINTCQYNKVRGKYQQKNADTLKHMSDAYACFAREHSSGCED